MMIEEMQELEARRQPDPFRLDIEWVEQPELFGIAARLEAEAARNVALMEKKRDRVKAELSLEIRQSPRDFDAPTRSGSVTLDTLESIRDLQPKMIEAENVLIEAKFVYDQARGLRQSFDHRKKALEELVRLHGQDYYSAPREPREMSKDEVDSVKERARKQRMEAIRRSRKQVNPGD